MDGPEAPLSAANEPSCCAVQEGPPEQQSAYAEADETWCEDLANAGQRQRNHDRSLQPVAASDKCTDADRDTLDLGNPLHILGAQGGDGLDASLDKDQAVEDAPVTTHGDSGQDCQAQVPLGSNSSASTCPLATTMTHLPWL